MIFFFFFFFQAEDGIRDLYVTGVQTCALPISRRAPDAEGVLRWDLFLWEPETGGVSRVTREADIISADPAPDGLWAAGVRSRYGITDFVRVDLTTGEVRPL